MKKEYKRLTRFSFYVNVQITFFKTFSILVLNNNGLLMLSAQTYTSRKCANVFRLTIYSRTSMARTILGPQIIVRDMGSSGHLG